MRASRASSSGLLPRKGSWDRVTVIGIARFGEGSRKNLLCLGDETDFDPPCIFYVFQTTFASPPLNGSLRYLAEILNQGCRLVSDLF
jgi:hypothetical protein